MTVKEITKMAQESYKKYFRNIQLVDDPVYRNDVVLDKTKIQQQINEMKRA
ncbi:MAG: hypothetical protein LUH02_12255 [Erysipelotrichaceae bacterium]|nr:hypothetical protein [Erysipelotrichaceae bacterium]